MFPLYDLNPHRRFPWVTVLIILANVVVMVFEGVEPSEQIVYHYGFIPKRVTELRTGKPIVVQPVRLNHAGQEVKGAAIKLSSDPADVYLTFLTTMFLHGSWIHLGIEHVDAVDLRQQRRRPARVVHVYLLLPGRRTGRHDLPVDVRPVEHGAR